MSHKKCCVPNCKEKESAIGHHVFIPPANMISTWNTLIPKSFKMTRTHKVCAQHFIDDFIIKEYQFIINGETVTLPRERWLLKPNAVPTIFPAPIKSVNKDQLNQRKTVIDVFTIKNAGKNEELLDRGIVSSNDNVISSDSIERRISQKDVNSNSFLESKNSAVSTKKENNLFVDSNLTAQKSLRKRNHVLEKKVEKLKKKLFIYKQHLTQSRLKVSQLEDTLQKYKERGVDLSTW